MNKIRVVLVDDHAVLRAGLKLLINLQKDMEVVGEGANQIEALEAVKSLKPDVVSLDLSMPGGGAKLIETICRENPQTRVLILTMHDDQAYVRMTLAAGAAGYVVKKAADTELLTAIRTVAKGGMYAQAGSSHPDLKNIGLKKTLGPAGGNLLDSLSEREREVMCWVAQGHTNQSIAERLFLSVKTIESYRSRLMSKLGLKNRAELTTFAMDSGLLTQEPSPEIQDAGETPAN